MNNQIPAIPNSQIIYFPLDFPTLFFLKSPQMLTPIQAKELKEAIDRWLEKLEADHSRKRREI